MLNPFPDLLALSFFAPTIIRVLAAALILLSAYWHSGPRAATRIISVLGFGELIVGVLLLVGFYTQFAAIGALFAIAAAAVAYMREYEGVVVYSRAVYVLLAGICFSLLVSGAGALAFDIPL